MTQFSPDPMNPSSPPIEPGAFDLAPEQSKWPQLLGIIGVAWASLGMVCGCAGFFAIPFQKWAADMQAQSGQSDALLEAQIRVGEQLLIPMIVVMGLGVLAAGWLLIGSIQLLRRRRSARTHLIGWALVSLLLLALNVALQVISYQATVQALHDAGEAHRAGELLIGLIIGGVFMVIFGLLPQAFTLIWLSRAKIKAEMEQWR